MFKIKKGITMTSTKQKWGDLSIKEQITYIVAFLAFILGWTLTILGFYVPPVGEVADSVLFILGESLIFVSSIIGVTSYFNSEARNLRHSVHSRMNEIEQGMIEREKIRNGIEV